MKTIITLTTFLILTTCFVVAQPILTMTDLGHQIGDVIILDSVDYVDVSGQTGADVSWDLSGVAGYGYVLQMEIFQPAGLPNSELFPTSNMVRRVIFQGIDFYQYLETSSDQMNYAGNSLSIGIIESLTIHSNSELFLETPITYGSNYSDTYQHELTSNFGTSNTTGFTELEAVGYGTLALDEIYNDVILMRTQRWDTLVTTLQAGDVTTYSYDDIYSFLKADFHFPLVTFGTHTTTQDNQAPQTTYDGSILLLQTDPSGVAELGISIPEIELYPNPILDEVVNMSFTLEHQENIQLDLYDIQGRLVSNLIRKLPYGPGINDVRMNLPANLESGIYVVKIIGENWTSTELLRSE